MKKFTITFMLMTLVQFAWAQPKNQYTERLDSIVTRTCHYRRPSNDWYWTGITKQLFFYTDQGHIQQVHYYMWKDNGWALTNKREYYQDAAGRDTLLLIYVRDNDTWLSASRQRSIYDEKGLLVSEEKDGYRYDHSYDETGRKTTSETYSKRNGQWGRRSVTNYTYDAQGHLTTVISEDYSSAQYVRRNKSILQYNQQGDLIAQNDSVDYENGMREWKSHTYVYYQDSDDPSDSALEPPMTKETIVLTTIDHDMTFQTKRERFYDSDKNLGQEYVYRKRGDVWVWKENISYLYDEEVSRDVVAGSSFLDDADDTFHASNKLLGVFHFMMDGSEGYETNYYYSRVHQ